VRVILQGSLEHFPAAELLPLLVAHAHSGTLVVEEKGKRVRIFLRRGKVDWTEASDGLGAEEVLLDLFTWRGGEFSLQDDVILPDGARALDLDPTILIEEGKRRSEYRPDQMFSVVNPPGDRDQISLSPDEFNALFRIGGGRTLAQVATDLGRAFADVVPLIRTLQANGLIREIDQSRLAEETFQVSALSSGGEAPPAVDESTENDRRGRLSSTPKTKTRARTIAGSLTVQGAAADVHPLLDNEYLIGRDSANTIVLADVSVSSKHARVARTAEGFVIEDLKSRNGTFVNGERVTDKRILEDNDVVRFGRVILTFNVATETKAGEMTNPELK